VPGLGSGFGVGGEGGRGLSPRQRLALLVSGVTLAAAMLIVLMLSPRDPPAQPPRDLLGYGAPGATLAVRVDRAMEIGRHLAQSRVLAEARSLGLYASWRTWGEALVARLPAALRDLAPLAQRLLEHDVALFLYEGAHGTEVAIVARASAPVSLDLPTKDPEEYRGHRLATFSPALGRALHVTWRGLHVFVASTRERLRGLVDRHVGASGPRLTEDPGFQAAVGALPRSERAFAFLDVGRMPRAARQAFAPLGEAKAAALSVDLRPGGVKLAVGLAHGALAPRAAQAASLLGVARPFRVPDVAPPQALAFVGARLSPSRLQDWIAAPTPGWLGAARDALTRVVGSDLLPELARSVSGEIAAGLVGARPFPSAFVAARLRDGEPARPSLDRLAETAALAPSALAAAPRERSVGPVRLLTRELPVGGGTGYGLHGGWLFGGGLEAAEGVARALSGTKWKPSAMARELLFEPAQVLGWVDVRALVAGLRRGAIAVPALREALERWGRLPETLVDLGFVARFEPKRVEVRGFVRIRDL
jgi:hypothetical protein